MPIVPSSAYNSCRQVTQLMRSLLNDTQNFGGTIVSVQRTSNSATYTYTPSVTGLPPTVNIIAGDVVIISGVTDNSFNGTFVVSNGPAWNQFTCANAGGNASSSGGSFVAPGLGAVFCDAVLIPYANSAYRGVQRGVAMSGSTTFKVDDILLVVPKIAQADPSVQVFIADSTAPPNQLPPDLIVPVKIWERPNLSSNDFVEMTDLTSAGGLPPTVQGQTLGIWEWRQDAIYFTGALQDTQIRLRYQKSLGDMSDGTSQILIRNAQEAVAYGAANLVAMSRGSQQSDSWATKGDAAIEALIASYTRQQQFAPRRRRYYSSRGRGQVW